MTRLVVAPGQTATAAWANATHDQTGIPFASAAERTAQWPSPPDGARSWLTDSSTPWVYRAGAWHAAPMGMLASNIGPGSSQDVSAAQALASVSVPVVAGRSYRVYAWFIGGTQVTASATIVREYIDIDAGAVTANFAYSTSLAVGGVLLGSGHYVYTAGTSKSVVFAAKALANAGALRVAANNAGISVDDIGN